MIVKLMLAVCLVWLSLGTSVIAADRRQNPVSPRLFIDIVAVTQFTDKKYIEVSDGLTDSYSEVADSLESLFRTSQPGAVIKVRKLAAETSYSAIQHLLYQEMAVRKDSVNLLFILTHGHLEQFPGSLAAGRDVFLAASDTSYTDVRGTALPASALLAAVTHFPASSSTFIFIDACHAGGASNVFVRLNKSLWEQMGVNLMLLVSSGAYQRSFNALFTKALIAQWSERSTNCLDGQVRVADALESKIKDIVGARTFSALNQRISMIVPYAGQFCLDSLSTHGALLLVRNPTPDGFKLKLRHLDGSGREQEMELPATSMLPIKVDRVSYVLEALNEAGNAVQEPFYLDMAEGPVRPLSLGSRNADPSVDARLLQESSQWAERAGLPARFYEDLSLKALGLLGRTGRVQEAKSLLKTIIGRGVQDPVVSFILNLEPQISSPVEVRRRAVARGLDMNDVAIALGHAGRFSTSAQLCEEQLATAPIPGNASLFECAYLGWTAAGQPLKALAVMKTAEAGNSFLYCDDCLKAASSGGGARVGIRLVMDKVRQQN